MFPQTDKHFIISQARQLKAKYEHLLENIDLAYQGDGFIKSNVQNSIQQIDDIIDTLENLESYFLNDKLANGIDRHPFSINKILEARDWGDDFLPEAIRTWRRTLNSESYAEIPPEDRKAIFDFFFRFDIYGNLRNGNTTHLSRGVNNPEYFYPPAIVKAAINTASHQNWFGYSDSLGHIETREAIANLERARRDQTNFKHDNMAVIQGGTAGMHALLSMISKEGNGKDCIVITPNYAPLIDDIQHHFTPRLVTLGDDYRIDPNELLRLAGDPDTSVMLLSIPHNPGGFADLGDMLPQLHEALKANNAYLVIDEIIYDEKLSPAFDPIQHDRVIVVSSYSKTYNIPGLKLGHLMASKEFIDRFYRHASTTYGSPPSFLYFTATCLMNMEYEKTTGNRLPNPEVLTPHVSDYDLLRHEFFLWKENFNLHRQFQKHVIKQALSREGGHAVDKIFGIDDPSPNFIMRLKGKQNAYKTALGILASCNVSVMPIECFISPQQWPTDLRITSAVKPQALATSFYRVVQHISNESTYAEPRDRLLLGKCVP